MVHTLCFLFPLLIAVSTPLSIFAKEAKSADALAESGQAFLLTLNPDQLDKALIPFQDERRVDWHFIPKDSRKGLSFAELSDTQSQLLWAFWETALSREGLTKTKGVIAAEKILWEQSGHADYRNPEKYYMVFFGRPETAGTWGASLEGHHLSLNLTVVDGKAIFVTPSFMGASPDRNREGAQPLKGEYDQALRLLNMFGAEQMALAHRSKVKPHNLFTGARKRVDPMKPEGLPASEMSQGQRAQLMQLIQEYVGRYRSAIAEDDVRKIEEAGIENIYFLWVGSDEPGKPVYYRVQGPSFVLEYSNRQSAGNHSHSVWRDFENDFAYDALGEHMEHYH